MAQEYTISNSFPAKDKEGNPKTWSSQYGTFVVWNIYFEGDDTRYLTNKKEGFEGYAKGEVVYGTVGEDRFGNATFKTEQRPMGELPKKQSAPAQQSSGGSVNLKEVNDKLDYIIGMLENQFPSQKKTTSPESLANNDEPVSLDEIDF